MALKNVGHLSKVEFCTGNDNLAMTGRKRHITLPRLYCLFFLVTILAEKR